MDRLACRLAAAGLSELVHGLVCPCRSDAAQHAFVTNVGSQQLLLDPATVRRTDTTTKSINEWTGEKTSRDTDISEDIKPESVAALGIYAVQILWQDGVRSGELCWPLVWQPHG